MRKNVIMIGATGAVGGHALATLLEMPQIERVTTLGRRLIEDIDSPKLTQHIVDMSDPASYSQLIDGHDCAICTLGVGEPSKVSREDFVRVDKEMVLGFAAACRAGGVGHFELLSSVGVSSTSRSFYLRTKGELEDALRALSFERLSLFHPSMIMTPNNRYGFTQAVALAVWPKLDAVLRGGAESYRGVKVEVLGESIARNLERASSARVEVLEWRDFQELT